MAGPPCRQREKRYRAAQTCSNGKGVVGVRILQLNPAPHQQAQRRGLAVEQPYATRHIITFQALLLSSFNYKTDPVRRSKYLPV